VPPGVKSYNAVMPMPAEYVSPVEDVSVAAEELDIVTLSPSYSWSNNGEQTTSSNASLAGNAEGDIDKDALPGFNATTTTNESSNTSIQPNQASGGTLGTIESSSSSSPDIVSSSRTADSKIERKRNRTGRKQKAEAPEDKYAFQAAETETSVERLKEAEIEYKEEEERSDLDDQSAEYADLAIVEMDEVNAAEKKADEGLRDEDGSLEQANFEEYANDGNSLDFAFADSTVVLNSTSPGNNNGLAVDPTIDGSSALTYSGLNEQFISNDATNQVNYFSTGDNVQLINGTVPVTAGRSLAKDKSMLGLLFTAL